MSNETHTHKVIAYYNETAADYKLFWTGKELAIHYGYYDEAVKSHSAALIKMNEVLASYVNLSSSDRVLDAGCGYGGSALWLARTIGCQVVGITIVPAQVSEARQHAQKQNMSHRVSFEQMDYTNTTFPDASFDVVWALESFVHTANREGVLREVARLLRPGGRLLISEYMFREDPPLSAEEKAAFAPWLDGWAMADFLTVGEYRRLLEASGFNIVRVEDLTEHVIPSLTRAGKLQIPILPPLMVFIVIARALRWLRVFSRERVQNLEAGFCLIETVRLGQWKYTVLRADKA